VPVREAVENAPFLRLGNLPHDNLVALAIFPQKLIPGFLELRWRKQAESGAQLACHSRSRWSGTSGTPFDAIRTLWLSVIARLSASSSTHEPAPEAGSSLFRLGRFVSDQAELLGVLLD
jgi:hypothetical protein